MVYPAETKHSLRTRLQESGDTHQASLVCLDSLAFPLAFYRAAQASVKREKANAYIGTWQFDIQENLSTFAGGRDYSG
jgi:hypothetical protein